MAYLNTTCARTELCFWFAGLISGVVAMSGTMLNQILNRNPRHATLQLAKGIGCPKLENSEEILKCLQNATAEEIALLQGPYFTPSVEALPLDGNMENVFLPDTPIRLMTSGRVSRVPLIVGINNGEEIPQAYCKSMSVLAVLVNGVVCDLQHSHTNLI
jgi:carboxylesterase type B